MRKSLIFLHELSETYQLVYQGKMKGEKDSQRSTVLFGEGILLLMGCSKKLYNVLGVTIIIIHIYSKKCVQNQNLYKYFFVQFAHNFSSTPKILTKFHHLFLSHLSNCLKKDSQTRFFRYAPSPEEDWHIYEEYQYFQ